MDAVALRFHSLPALNPVSPRGTLASPFSFLMFYVTPVKTFWSCLCARSNQGGRDWINISTFFIEFIVGACMLLVVTWLVLFWTREIEECWKTHTRVRYYFGLTLIGTMVNLALGVCGTAYVVRDNGG